MPRDLWMKSKRAYNEYDFYRAAAITGKLATEMPEFENLDSARILITKSLLTFDFYDAPRQLIDSIMFYAFADTLLADIRALEFEIAVIGNNIEAPYLYQAIKSRGTDGGLGGNVEYLMGVYFFHRGEYERAIGHFLLVDNESDKYDIAQRDLKVAQYLSEKNIRYILPDRALVDRYKSLMKEHEVLGLKVMELISTHESSYTIMKLSEIEKQINQNLVLIE